MADWWSDTEKDLQGRYKEIRNIIANTQRRNVMLNVQKKRIEMFAKCKKQHLAELTLLEKASKEKLAEKDKEIAELKYIRMGFSDTEIAKKVETLKKTVEKIRKERCVCEFLIQGKGYKCAYCYDAEDILKVFGVFRQR